jgi:enhancing lycopene biosynthesis protein 2
MVRVGILLSGCGVYDGSEIQETVLTLLFLDRLNATSICIAPSLDQTQVVNHRTGKPAEESRRNVLDESARITRGKIQDLAKVKSSDLDALILPGGFGAAKNLSNFSTAGSHAKVDPLVARLLREMHKSRKPIAAWCIAPAVVAAALRDDPAHPKLTIGSDEKTARAIEEMGAKHVVCPVEEFRVDEEQRIVSTPAYMYDATISEVAEGIERAVKELVRLAS